MDENTVATITFVANLLDTIGTLALTGLIAYGFYTGELFSRKTVTFITGQVTQPLLAAIQELTKAVQHLNEQR